MESFIICQGKERISIWDVPVLVSESSRGLFFASTFISPRLNLGSYS